MKNKWVIKPKWVKMYLDIASRLASESHATRLKVGALFVSVDGIMSSGINGLPAGGSNVCEYHPDMHDDDGNFLMVSPYLTTKPEVSHAEENLWGKLMRQGVCTKGGVMFITHSPCLNCAKIMVQADISAVYYLDDYRDFAGIDWLKKNNISVHKRGYNAII